MAPADARARNLALPQVPGRGLEPARDGGPLVVIAKTAIVVEGESIVAVANGHVDPSEKEGGRLGMKIEKLSRFLAAVPRADALQIAADPQTPYRLFTEVLFSAKQAPAHWKRFEILAQDGARTVHIPIALPETPAVTVSPRDAGFDLARQIEQRARGSLTVTITDGPDGPVIAARKAIETKYLPGIKRCFDGAGGKVTVAVRVAANGRVTGADARGFDAGIDRCIEQLATSWRVPSHDEDFTFTASLQLAIDASAPPPARAPTTPIDTRPLEPPDQQPLQLVVSVTPHELAVWSISGLEGTLASPKLRVAIDDPEALAKLAAAVAEIAERRWRGTSRDAASRQVVLMADNAIPMQRVVEIMAAVRPAFPDLLLSTGLQ